MEEMVEDSVDCYWIIRCFVNQLNNKYRDSLPQLVRDVFGCWQEVGMSSGTGVFRKHSYLLVLPQLGVDPL